MAQLQQTLNLSTETFTKNKEQRREIIANRLFFKSRKKYNQVIDVKIFRNSKIKNNHYLVKINQKRQK